MLQTRNFYLHFFQSAVSMKTLPLMTSCHKTTPSSGKLKVTLGLNMADTQGLFDCSICLQLLEDPVSTACGHNYCKICINTFWDKNNNGGKSYSCPHCRQTFYPRPELRRNTLLANLLEHRRTFSQNADEDDDDDDTFADPGDVECDACKEKKSKAVMFCLVCLASFCKTHLQPHFEVPPLQKHSLIPASARIKESICGRHDKLLEIYCRTDQQFVCLMCVLDQHKGHDTVGVSAEKCEMQVTPFSSVHVLFYCH